MATGKPQGIAADVVLHRLGGGVLVMELQAGRVLELLDPQQRVLGRVALEGREDGLLLGRFTPGPGLLAVERLFRDFEEAVNSQSLRAVDELDGAIGALGLHLRAPGGADAIKIKDVQIWSDGGITCRLTGAGAGVVNGSAQES